MTFDLNKLSDLEFTDDGYLVSNGCYLGVKDDDDFDWYGNIELCRDNLKPVLNIKVLDDMLDYIDYMKG